VHQHFMLVPVFTVAENVILGFEPTGKGGIINLKEARRRVREISDKFGFNIDPDALVGDLPVGSQQRVEIIKALSRDAKILILDEPTAVLTPQEADQLFITLQRLAGEGCAVIYISHRLEEVKRLCHNVTILRHGKVVANVDPAQETASSLAKLMVGGDIHVVRATSRDVPPQPVVSPLCICRKAKRASAEATRKSQAVRISHPPPTASPSTAAITGQGKSVSWASAALITRFSRSPAALSGCPDSSFKSPPDTNDPFAPAMMRTRIASLWFAAVTQSAKASWAAQLRAFLASGRFTRNSAIPSARTSSSTSLFIGSTIAEIRARRICARIETSDIRPSASNEAILLRFIVTGSR